MQQAETQMGNMEASQKHNQLPRNKRVGGQLTIHKPTLRRLTTAASCNLTARGSSEKGKCDVDSLCGTQHYPHVWINPHTELWLADQDFNDCQQQL